jgi:hypothetical protein
MHRVRNVLPKSYNIKDVSLTILHGKTYKQGENKKVVGFFCCFYKVELESKNEECLCVCLSMVRKVNQLS